MAAAKRDDRGELESVLAEFHRRAEELYGPRLKGVVLYGSWSRGEAGPDSDIDLAVILAGRVEPGLEVDRLLDLTFELDLKYGVLLSVYPVSEGDYHDRRSPLLLNLRREGVPA